MTQVNQILNFEEVATIAKRIGRVMSDARAKKKRLRMVRVEVPGETWLEWRMDGEITVVHRGSYGTLLSPEAVASLTWEQRKNLISNAA
jgi:hypothetical protein